jgi:putative membrane protein
MERDMLKLFATTAAVALLALSAPAISQTATPGKAPSATPAAPAAPAGRSDTKQDRADKLARQDEKFVKEAAEGGMAEVQLGKLAQQKAQSPEVKKLAETIVKDHEAANAQLTAIGSGKGVDLPKATAEMKGDHKKLHDKLSKANGLEFDREYVKAMVDDHKKDIKKFEEQAKDGKDAELKAFAQQTVPKLKEHLQMAEQAQKSLQSQTSQERRGTTGSAGSTTAPSGSAPATGSSPARPATR